MTPSPGRNCTGATVTFVGHAEFHVLGYEDSGNSVPLRCGVRAPADAKRLTGDSAGSSTHLRRWGGFRAIRQTPRAMAKTPRADRTQAFRSLWTISPRMSAKAPTPSIRMPRTLSMPKIHPCRKSRLPPAIVHANRRVGRLTPGGEGSYRDWYGRSCHVHARPGCAGFEEDRIKRH